MLAGATILANAVVGLFFFRYWRNTRDSFFLLFAASFWIEAANRMALALVVGNELEPVFYMVRVIAYGLIVVAIVQKNRKAP
ncbi:hypothetical protein EZ216_02035 [Ramlibacter humi]|uniref:Uncharacterized protein n=2 Tax=Ramlibacter humi TaxID=2530451 RepID=A0A4Z0CES9_9BURK|nr:hypothetical protein EZ216_02035 [Ramlibacter humi]